MKLLSIGADRKKYIFKLAKLLFLCELLRFIRFDYSLKRPGY